MMWLYAVGLQSVRSKYYFVHIVHSSLLLLACLASVDVSVTCQHLIVSIDNRASEQSVKSSNVLRTQYIDALITTVRICAVVLCIAHFQQHLCAQWWRCHTG